MTVSGADRTFDHTPVMLTEIVAAFASVPSGTYVDATLGGAGHAVALLEAREDFDLVGIDRDASAIEAAQRRLDPFSGRFRVERGRFDELQRLVGDDHQSPVTAVLFDLGVSSPQLDRPERGFSYREPGPLDMRMDDRDSVTADEIVNTWSEHDIADALRTYGDERFAGRIARAIVGARPIADTAVLAELVREAIPAATRRKGGHPAKRTFQALRIVVNQELDQIDAALRQAVSVLAPGGRGAVLSYHSGEDRIVKQTIASEETGGCACPARLPCVCGAQARVAAVPPRRRTPSDQEMQDNPRAASAQLRVFERLAVAQ